MLIAYIENTHTHNSHIERFVWQIFRDSCAFFIIILIIFFRSACVCVCVNACVIVVTLTVMVFWNANYWLLLQFRPTIPTTIAMSILNRIESAYQHIAHTLTFQIFCKIEIFKRFSPLIKKRMCVCAVVLDFCWYLDNMSFIAVFFVCVCVLTETRLNGHLM